MRGRRGRISDDARPSTLSRLARHGWATSQRRGGRCGGEQRVQRRGGRRVNEGESVSQSYQSVSEPWRDTRHTVSRHTTLCLTTHDTVSHDTRHRVCDTHDTHFVNTM